MKARIKATGKIVDVREEYDLRGSMVQVFYSNEENPQEFYEKEDIDFNIEYAGDSDYWTDYWTRIEHQAAIAAMQGILMNPIGFENLRARGKNLQTETAQLASEFAYALVEKLKESK
jgi:hypothetical protein